MFSYVFGSAISDPGGGDYHAYLVSGIFAQSMLGTVPGIAVGVASDIRWGLIDRLRTLPISRVSVIAGRTIAELAELARRHRGRRGVRPDRRLGAARHRARDRRRPSALLLVCAFAVTWAGIFLGLMVRDPDGADGIAMAFIFPAMFLSGIFVPVAGLPSPLREFAEINPLTALATALRELFGVADRAAPRRLDAPAPRAHLAGLGRWASWAIFGPLGVRRYQRMGR